VTPELTGAALGLLGAGGVVLAVAASPPLRRPRLHDRLAPYVRDTVRPSRLLDRGRNVTPFPTVERLLVPLLRDAASFVDRLVGGAASVRRRLERCGSDMTVEQFRVEQVLWSAGGLLISLLLASLALVRAHTLNPVAVLLLAVTGAATGGLARDRALTAAAQRREARMLEEFPTIADLLALSVAAGEGAAGALARVAGLATGELSRELGRALSDARAGASLVAALEAMAARSGVPALSRFVDGMAIAVERGTPLAEVLRAQAVDVREQHRRALLDIGGRKEIAMLVPVVFLVLPVTVVFALFPGFYNLSLTVP
jgi:tight adherence protein C